MKFKNTLQKGSVRYIVFKEKSKWYAVGLEFNIIEAGNDPREVLLLLFEAIQGYVKSASKVKARPYVLNQEADEEYENLWNILQRKKGVPTPSPMPFIYAFGEQSLAIAK